MLRRQPHAYSYMSDAFCCCLHNKRKQCRKMCGFWEEISATEKKLQRNYILNCDSLIINANDGRSIHSTDHFACDLHTNSHQVYPDLVVSMKRELSLYHVNAVFKIVFFHSHS